jgi:hypothetical protein
MGTDNVVAAQFSRMRLRGEAVPPDVMVLLDHNDTLFERTGVRLNWDDGWAPWSDTSYLRQEELDDPGIAANIRAIADVCNHIAFIAEHEDSEYLGYWRGVDERPVAQSPLVCLDSEGQFRLSLGRTFAEALLARTWGEEQFDELRRWLHSIGIRTSAETFGNLAEPTVLPTPDQIHEILWRKYLR